MKLAAIDIGSNAARLLINEVITLNNGEKDFQKLNLVRVPLRLGFDVFEKGSISKERMKMTIETMKAFGHLLRVYEVKHIAAAATSAMRDASNAEELIRRVKLETGIEIRVISGEEEAFIVYESHIAESLNRDHAYMYIDVGGGSTEVTIFNKGEVSFKESFNVGTIRLLTGKVKESYWDYVKDTIRERTKKLNGIIAIGSGGNINKVFSLSKRKEGKPLSLELLKDYYKEFNALTVQERMHLYQLKEDRADVIVPALQIYVSIMRWANADEIFVPKIGLADGLIHHLYESVSNGK
jgi:exopolyphosphatase/guanosine-5'-triphosphate,3'-diphosphate pyrophosphatase